MYINAQIGGPLSGATGNHLLIPSLTAFDPERSPLRIPVGPPRLFIGFVLTEHATSIPRREFRGTPRQARQVICQRKAPPKRGFNCPHACRRHSPHSHNVEPGLRFDELGKIYFAANPFYSSANLQPDRYERGLGSRTIQRNHTLMRSVDDFRSRSAPPFMANHWPDQARLHSTDADIGQDLSLGERRPA